MSWKERVREKERQIPRGEGKSKGERETDTQRGKKGEVCVG